VTKNNETRRLARRLLKKGPFVYETQGTTEWGEGERMTVKRGKKGKNAKPQGDLARRTGTSLTWGGKVPAS